MRIAYPNTDCDRDGHGNSYRYGNSDSYRYSDSYCNSDGYGNSDGYCNAYGYGDRAAEAVTDAQAEAYTAASSIALIGFLKVGTRETYSRVPRLRWIGFSEDDAKWIAEGANIWRQNGGSFATR